jgi:hypothetical protein
VSNDIIDLDILVPADKKASLGGKTYTVPGDMPMETYLKVAKVSAAEDSGADEGELLGEMVEALVELFAYKLPDDTTDAGKSARDEVRGVLRKLGIRTITQILGKLYGDDDDVPSGDNEGEGAGDPPTAGSTTTS